MDQGHGLEIRREQIRTASMGQGVKNCWLSKDARSLWTMGLTCVKQCTNKYGMGIGCTRSETVQRLNALIPVIAFTAVVDDERSTTHFPA
jgi:hypothetical protein